jgi:uroporphyrinogen-III synthase
MTAVSRPDLRGLRVAITAERRADEQAALVRALGGVPFVCPTARVAWEDDTEAPQRWLDTLCAGVDDAVFMTGMGTERLLQHAHAVGRIDEAVGQLGAARVVVRGSKAQPVLRRHGVHVDMAPRPATSTGVLAALGSGLRGRRALVQLAGPEPQPLTSAMRAAGADVVSVCIYRYPPDAVVGAADDLVEAIVSGELDAVTFTSAPAVEGLVAAAVQIGEWPAVRRRLNAMIVAAVGPVTADALARNAVAVQVQPAEPRMGPMMRELAGQVAARE